MRRSSSRTQAGMVDCSWGSAKARSVLAALLQLGWSIKRQSGSHRTLSRGPTAPEQRGREGSIPSASFGSTSPQGQRMSEESLRALVVTLRSELAQAHDLDADAREVLRGLARELEAALQDAHPSSGVIEPPLRDRLADRVRELEASHPKLSRTVGNIVDTLAFYNL
jgi:hypothetical protein